MRSVRAIHRNDVQGLSRILDEIDDAALRLKRGTTPA